ncbi:MAG: hypothetical protein ACMUJJ_15680 [Roseicyclus sp.]|uniref:hypothetical protein n=1 Tax=Roseicyclus sp. TaxID=1914329 RepID=UPI003A889737
MDFRHQELIQVQVVGTVLIGLLVGLCLAPWGNLIDGNSDTKLVSAVGILTSVVVTTFLVYLGLGFLIVASWFTYGYSMMLMHYQEEGRWTGVGALIGAPSGGISAASWSYDASNLAEAAVFFFGGGFVGLAVGAVFAGALQRSITRK